MDNHIHIIWQLQAGRKRQDVQRDFLKYTAQQIKKEILANHFEQIKDFFVNAKDRKSNFGKKSAFH